MDLNLCGRLRHIRTKVIATTIEQGTGIKFNQLPTINICASTISDNLLRRVRFFPLLLLSLGFSWLLRFATLSEVDFHSGRYNRNALHSSLDALTHVWCVCVWKSILARQHGTCCCRTLERWITCRRTMWIRTKHRTRKLRPQIPMNILFSSFVLFLQRISIATSSFVVRYQQLRQLPFTPNLDKTFFFSLSLAISFLFFFLRGGTAKTFDSIKRRTHTQQEKRTSYILFAK